MRKPELKLILRPTKVTYKIPAILSQTEVQKIINAAINIRNKTLLIIIYGAGLRVSEAVKLRKGDIDRSRMTLHIRCCKNRKDRLVILSPIVLNYLEIYWKQCKFENYIFPGNGIDHITAGTAASIYKKAKKSAGVTKTGGIHALRHAFATHSLESGINLFAIKQLLGHSSIHSTVRYLSFVPNINQNIKSPIDNLEL